MNRIFHSFALWLREARFKALMLAGAVFMFSLLRTLESVRRGNLLKRMFEKSPQMQGLRGPSPDVSGNRPNCIQPYARSIVKSRLFKHPLSNKLSPRGFDQIVKDNFAGLRQMLSRRYDARYSGG